MNKTGKFKKKKILRKKRKVNDCPFFHKKKKNKNFLTPLTLHKKKNSGIPDSFEFISYLFFYFNTLFHSI